MCAKLLESLLVRSTALWKGKGRRKFAGAQFWARSPEPEHQAESNCTPGCAQRGSCPRGAGAWPGCGGARAGLGRAGAVSPVATEVATVA